MKTYYKCQNDGKKIIPFLENVICIAFKNNNGYSDHLIYANKIQQHLAFGDYDIDAPENKIRLCNSCNLERNKNINNTYPLHSGKVTNKQKYDILYRIRPLLILTDVPGSYRRNKINDINNKYFTQYEIANGRSIMDICDNPLNFL